MQVIITPHALMAPIHHDNINIDDFLLHYMLLNFFSRNDDFFSTCVFSDTVEILSENNLFPAFQTFHNYLHQHDLEEEISPRDLVTLFNNVMQNCEDIKEVNDVHEFEIDGRFSFPQITTTPICNNFTNNSVAFCGYLDKTKEFRILPLLDCNIVSDQYDYIIPKVCCLDGGEVVELENFEASISLYKSCADLISCYSSSDLWRKSTTDFSYKLAIFYKCKEISDSQADSFGKNVCLDSFEVGSRFIDSLNSHQCSGSGRFAMTLLDSIARLLLEEPKNEVKIFATTAGGSTPRTRGGDVAYRLHITKSGEGLRLMFWQKTCGTIELANVANKSEIVIY
ncbi:hypothetical protein P0F15_002262 [Vibrio metschnikovii]|uniref:Uncharacterized protein n=2 Tax=Unclassified Bacteria TaxID=49928 RepID=A0AAU6SQQ3_UNCXX|nr:hypothetical protein [Vibrio metschnikovii]EKO3574042.1 hypothetical protein [Vibrio metschnikovii]EKO3597061.1 hypothetical protein [Vibrio metschnikovii]EKO3600621.1 hypothetical protein [Vibrio metschnikovii]EKO3612487.1 hypothetical protein [Vibrio metschnikovii]